MDYKKLEDDLRVAKEVAIEAIQRVVDNGTFNTDSTFLVLPRAREKKVIEALKSAGLYGYKRKWAGTGYQIIPPGNGMANRRNKAMEALTQCLIEAGYDAITYYQMN